MRDAAAQQPPPTEGVAATSSDGGMRLSVERARELLGALSEVVEQLKVGKGLKSSASDPPDPDSEEKRNTKSFYITPRERCSRRR